ncbi:MAG: hypothetical protein KGQ70_03680 [Alphaproteobacteria bacterium]|nr:hypothetical protein [Alphaproteobacteria bacterium]
MNSAVPSPQDQDFKIVSAATVRELHKAFMDGITAKAQERIFVADKRYGIHNDAFSDLVKNFVEEKLNRGIYGEFNLENELYRDSIPYGSISRKHGAALNDGYGNLEWRAEGRRHRSCTPTAKNSGISTARFSARVNSRRGGKTARAQQEPCRNPRCEIIWCARREIVSVPKTLL